MSCKLHRTAELPAQTEVPHQVITFQCQITIQPFLSSTIIINHFCEFLRYDKNICLIGHRDLSTLSTKIKSVHPWLKVNSCATLEDISSNRSWDIFLTKWDGQTDNTFIRKRNVGIYTWIDPLWATNWTLWDLVVYCSVDKERHWPRVPQLSTFSHLGTESSHWLNLQLPLVTTIWDSQASSTKPGASHFKLPPLCSAQNKYRTFPRGSQETTEG